MGKSNYCPIHKGYYWSDDDNSPDEVACPRCADKHRLNNFYGLGVAILSQGMTGIGDQEVGDADKAEHADTGAAAVRQPGSS